MTPFPSATSSRRGLRTEVLEDYERMSQAAAEIVIRQVREDPRLLLCLATGGSPARAYELIALKGRAEPRLFDQLRILKLDEWGGLAKDAPGSCEGFLRERVIQPWGISEDRFFGFSNDAASPEAECERLHAWLAENGPIDLCLLGLGANGHLGLNEPARALSPFAHCEALSEESRHHPMLSGSGNGPAYGLTFGMADILQSRHILVLVNGARKREPLHRLMQKEIAGDFPASLLWLHPNAALLCDREAFPFNPNL